MTSVDKVAELKRVLVGMERDLGLSELNEVQKGIVYAAIILMGNSKDFETDDVRKHELLEGTPRSTFFRALKGLLDDGYIAHSVGRKRTIYNFSDKIIVKKS